MKKSFRYRHGFTLIELLVVISIIAILSSIILATVATARTKGTNAAIQSEVKELVNNFELLRTSTGYNFTCEQIKTANVLGIPSDSQSTALIAKINALNGGTLVTTSGGGSVSGWSTTGLMAPNIGVIVFITSPLICTTNNTAVTAPAYAVYAAYSPINSAGNNGLMSSGYFCMDSTGTTISSTASTLLESKETEAYCQ